MVRNDRHARGPPGAVRSDREAPSRTRAPAAAGSLKPGSSFVSATFAPEVAAEHFGGGPTTRTAVMWRRRIPAERVLMTFLETRALNDRFKEAEAVLIAEPGSEGL